MSEDVTRPRLYRIDTISVWAKELTLSRIRTIASSYNREITIFQTLISLCNQNFRNFEVIIVDCLSQDNTRSVIHEFFKSETFNNSKFEYRVEYKEYEPVSVEDWNEGLFYSNGLYTMSLEGDDQLLPNLLQDAYDFLIPYFSLF